VQLTFTGKEILQDPHLCVAQVVRRINSAPHTLIADAQQRAIGDTEYQYFSVNDDFTYTSIEKSRDLEEQTTGKPKTKRISIPFRQGYGYIRLVSVMCILLAFFVLGISYISWRNTAIELNAPEMSAARESTTLFLPTPQATTTRVLPSLSTPQASQRIIAVVVSEALNVRSAPNPTSPIVDKLIRNARVTVLEVKVTEENGEWSYIQTEDTNVTGWVNATFLRTIE
jgi:hypothetical protein